MSSRCTHRLELAGSLVSLSVSPEVKPCFAGVAETGTLAMLSGPERPVTLNFLPEAHIALVGTRDLVGAYEDMWARVREAGETPRAVNLITGPSRSADIGQELRMGAHGPRRLHIVLVDDGASDEA